MRAGARRTNVTLFGVTDGKDSDGGPTETEVEIGTAWVRLQPLVGREQFGAQQVYADVDAEVTMDWLDGQALTAKHRLGLGGRRFDIVAVLNVEDRNRELRLLVHERP